ncbi:MAG: GIY-YIG nuclease family protein [Candidatus Woesearchaeota archaeon]
MQLYKISFKTTDKCYIGITSKTAIERFKGHKNKTSKSLISKAIRKHGVKNTILTVIADCDNWELLCLAEVEAIEKYNTLTPAGYNCTLGGDGVFGFKWSDEQKTVQSEILKNYYIENPDHIDKLKESISNAYVNNPEKREAARKKTLDHYENHPETIEKMSKTHKELHKNNPSQILNLTKINKQLWDDDIDGEKRRKYGEKMSLFFKENPLACQEQSERMTIYYSDENNRIEQSKRLLDFHKNNPEHGIEQSKRLKERFSKEEERFAQSERKKLFFKNNPEAAKEHGKRIKARYENNPDLGKQHSKKMKDYYKNNPELKEKQSENLKQHYIKNPIARIRTSLCSLSNWAYKRGIPMSLLPIDYFYAKKAA